MCSMMVRSLTLAACLSAILVAAAGGGAAIAQEGPGGAAPGPGLIVEIQTQLQRHGYHPGPANGVLTAKTRRAILAYQRDTGLRPDGVASPRLAEDLRATETSGPGPGAEDPVAAAQAMLRGLGFDPGPIDGVLGPHTRDAIIRFQVAHRLAVDPRVSDRLLAELRRAAGEADGASATASPAPPAPQAASPEALGRQPLPPGVHPPPIR